jgi:hypothetical protein
MRFFIKNIFIILVAVVVLTGTAFAAGNIDSVQKYSQFLDSNIDLDSNGVKDFINWSPTTGGVTVSDTTLSGYIWGESVGWINLHPTNVWVSNSCTTGQLGGYAWGQNTGWINFDPTNATGINHPQIDLGTGKITGKAWSQNYGWIELSSPQAPTSTAYNPSLGLVTSWTPSGSCSSSGTNGSCGASNGQVLSGTPSSLCAAGAASTVVPTASGWIWTCVGSGGGSTASCAASKQVTTTGGGQVLSITKYVVGGTAANTDFTIKATNTGTNITTSRQSGIGVQYSLAAGTYQISEDPNPGYTAVYGGDCSTDGTVTLPKEVNKSCTVTNYYGTPPPPPVDYCLNIKLSIDDATAQGYTLSYSTNPVGYNCVKTTSQPQYCLNIPSLLVSDALATGYYASTQPTGYNCLKDTTNPPSPTYCTNNGALLLSDAQAQGYAIDSLGNCILSTGFICQNLGANLTVIPFGYHFASNGDCVPDVVDYCLLMDGIQTSPNDCPDLFTQPTMTTLGTFLEGFGGGGSPWLKWVLTAIAALGLAGSLPGAISRLGNEILTLAFGRKKWRGIVYDSDTKEPLDPVYVSVIDVVTGLEVTNQFTDIEGRFGFVLKPGKYKITAGKTNYVFPSVKLAGRYSDEAYDHLYFGEVFTVESADQVVTMNIPMDPTGTDWNQGEKHRTNWFRYFMKGQTKYVWFWNMLTVIGFLASIMITYFYPVWWNYVMTALYVVLAIYYAYGGWPISMGRVTKNGMPVTYAIVRAYSATLNHEVARRITSISGGYYLLLPKGDYIVTIEERNADGTYTKTFTSPTVHARGGIINKSFKI